MSTRLKRIFSYNSATFISALQAEYIRKGKISGLFFSRIDLNVDTFVIPFPFPFL